MWHEPLAIKTTLTDLKSPAARCGIVAAFFELIETLVEVVADTWPSKFDQEDQNGDCDGSDDEDRFQAHRTSFVAMNFAEQLSECGLGTHQTFPCRCRLLLSAVKFWCRLGTVFTSWAMQ
jgi:hypothetical protein